MDHEATRTQEIETARTALTAGTLSLDAFDALIARLTSGNRRQRLLYLHASMPGLYAPVVAAALHEPIPGRHTQIDPAAPDPPYKTVFEALCEGWRIVHFPDQRAPFDDREIDILGYEFILEKWEAI